MHLMKSKLEYVRTARRNELHFSSLASRTLRAAASSGIIEVLLLPACRAEEELGGASMWVIPGPRLQGLLSAVRAGDIECLERHLALPRPLAATYHSTPVLVEKQGYP